MIDRQDITTTTHRCDQNKEMAMEEALLCDILQNDIARQLYGRNRGNDTDGERSRRRQQNTSSTEEAAGGLGSQFASLGLNETERKAAKPAPKIRAERNRTQSETSTKATTDVVDRYPVQEV